ncbi:hypothetical protein DFJ74DRAFT_767434 [Hyaloraphidium curvatum]|nr:hypothetical protein DFJ74DRAFT_767434 [Hyaloraphidium curvatum]
MKLSTALAIGAAALLALASLAAAQVGTGTGTGSGSGSGCTCDGWKDVTVTSTVTYDPACGGNCKTKICLTFTGPTVPTCDISYFQFKWDFATLPTIESGPATSIVRIPPSLFHSASLTRRRHQDIKDGKLKLDINSGTSGFTVCFSVPGIYATAPTTGGIEIHAGQGQTLCTNPFNPPVPTGSDLGCPPCRSRSCSVGGGCTATPASVSPATQTFDCSVAPGCAKYTCNTPASCTRTVPCARSGTSGCTASCNELATPVTSGGACTPVCGNDFSGCTCTNSPAATVTAAVSVVWGSYTSGCTSTSGGPCTCVRTDIPGTAISSTCTAGQTCSEDAAVTMRRRVKAREL